MKKNLLRLFKNKTVIVAAITAGAFLTTVVASCTKSSNNGPNYATQFVGTWNTVSSTCGSTASFTYGAGSGSNTVTNTGSVGSGTCLKSITLSGTATSTGFAIGPQTVTDGCGNSYTISEVGTLSGSTLTMTETVTGAVNVSCTVTATK